MLSRWAFALLFLMYLKVYAVDVCFKNEREYQAAKSKLPVILRDLPLYFSTNGFLTQAAGTIQVNKEDLRFYFNCTRSLESPIEERISICANENEIKMKFDNGVSEIVEILSDNEVKVRDKLSIEKTNRDTFTTVAILIEGKLGQTPAKSRTESSKGENRQ